VYAFNKQLTTLKLHTKTFLINVLLTPSLKRKRLGVVVALQGQRFVLGAATSGLQNLIPH
jgi:hypothetical protein